MAGVINVNNCYRYASKSDLLQTFRNYFIIQLAWASGDRTLLSVHVSYVPTMHINACVFAAIKDNRLNTAIEYECWLSKAKNLVGEIYAERILRNTIKSCWRHLKTIGFELIYMNSELCYIKITEFINWFRMKKVST